MLIRHACIGVGSVLAVVYGCSTKSGGGLLGDSAGSSDSGDTGTTHVEHVDACDGLSPVVGDVSIAVEARTTSAWVIKFTVLYTDPQDDLIEATFRGGTYDRMNSEFVDLNTSVPIDGSQAVSDGTKVLFDVPVEMENEPFGVGGDVELTDAADCFGIRIITEETE